MIFYPQSDQQPKNVELTAMTSNETPAHVGVSYLYLQIDYLPGLPSILHYNLEFVKHEYSILFDIIA